MPMATRTAEVLLVDDHDVFVESLAFVLGADDRFGEARVARSVAHARELLADPGLVVDVAVVDVALPDGDGTDLVGPLLEARPGVRVLVLTAHPRPEVVARARRAGAVGVLPKGTGLQVLLDAIAGEADDLPWASAEPVAESPLTAREVEVVRHLARGHDARGIARELGLSAYTVRDHIKSVLLKLEVHSQLDAVLAAHRAGLVDLDRP